MITAVSAFVPIPGHPRSEAEYRELGQRLVKMGSRISLMTAEGKLEDCWLWHWLMEGNVKNFTWSVADNPKKNSLAYHCVQAQKTEFLVEAAAIDPTADVFVWIDYGIFHIPGVTQQVIVDFLGRADNEQAISIPGCWDLNDFVYDDNQPCWRFCGGVMVVPRAYVDRLDVAMKNEYVRWLEITGNISWEVNTLTRVEYLNQNLPIWWYRADHDKTLFINYKATENADRAYTSTEIPKREHWLNG